MWTVLFTVVSISNFNCANLTILDISIIVYHFTRLLVVCVFENVNYISLNPILLPELNITCLMNTL